MIIRDGTINGALSPIGKVVGNVSGGGKVSGEVQSAGTPMHYYDGPYDVIPRAEMQILETATKLMRDNVTVEEIPYTEVTNLSGGLTVSIA